MNVNRVKMNVIQQLGNVHQSLPILLRMTLWANEARPLYQRSHDWSSPTTLVIWTLIYTYWEYVAHDSIAESEFLKSIITFRVGFPSSTISVIGCVTIRTISSLKLCWLQDCFFKTPFFCMNRHVDLSRV